jgi:CBS domain-containing protein
MEGRYAMKVQDVMTESVRTCSSEESLAEAAAIMWSADCGVLPVLTDGKVVGVITDRDIAIALGTRDKRAADIPIKDVMTEKVFFATPEEDIHAALKTMRKERIRRLPVLNNNGLIEGIVSMNDIALHAEKFDGHRTTELSYEDAMNTLKAICEHRHQKQLKKAGKAAVQ